MRRGAIVILLLMLTLVALPAMGAPSLTPILSPGDYIIAIDSDGIVSNSSYPGAESPPNLLDSNPDTKYLNFGGPGSGFIVTPSAPAQVRSFQMTTANDVPGRDPASWQLFGTNSPITSVDNSTGDTEDWLLIDSGLVTLPTERKTLGPVVTVNNNQAYSSYRMIYPETVGSNLFQLADISFFESTDGSGANILSSTDPILAIHQGMDSSYPAAENPSNAIDGTLAKYLNFGEENSGFIVTPSAGASVVQAFQITTANDAEERDPASWELYGRNNSTDNSAGDAENWKLIDSGTLDLPSDRNTLGALVPVDNSDSYISYKMIFPNVKNADSANSMQIGEIQFYTVPEPTMIALLGLGGLSLIRRRRQQR